MPPRRTSSKRDFRDPRNPQDIARGYTAGARGTPKTPTREGPSFMDTLQSLGRQRAAQPPRTPAVRPTQEGPSFAQTMGQVGQQRWEENLGRNVRDDAAIAGGYGYRNPTDPGVVLAQTLGMDHVSPAGQENFARNAAQHYPNQLFYAGGGRPPGSLMADPGSVSFPPRVSPTGNINPNAVPLSVASMLDVFRNDPAAMSALISGQGGYPGYNPQFTGLQQNAYPWEPWNPVFGGMATTQHGPTNLGGWYGSGTWDPTISRWYDNNLNLINMGNTSPTGAPSWWEQARGSANSRFINPRRTGNFMSGY